MRFEFIVDEHVKVKTFLKKHEVSKGLLAKIKFRGGQILVNGRPENAIYLLDIGDRLVIDIPAEEGFETLKPMDRPLDILFEDDHFLVLNKPFGIASIPSAATIQVAPAPNTGLIPSKSPSATPAKEA